MKQNYKMVLLCLFGMMLLFIVVILSGKATKQIKLPKGAQHNTIGELPIVEMVDDGNYDVVDARETASNLQRAIEVTKNACRYYLKGEKLKNCLKDAENLKGYTCPSCSTTASCEDLERIGDKYNIGVCYTCWGSFVAY